MDARRAQRGFSLLEITITLAVVGVLLLALGSIRSARPPQAHAAALQLQAALSETRALAMANAGLTNADNSSTGATLSVVPVGRDTTLTVFRSRPIAGRSAPVRDRGLPPIHLPAHITVAGRTTRDQPFSIFVSSSGYASVAPGYAYDADVPSTYPSDPGCDERGVAIVVSAASGVETHPFDCRGATYDANSIVPGTRALP